MSDADLIEIAARGSRCSFGVVNLVTSTEVLSATNTTSLAEAVYGWLAEMMPVQGVMWRAGGTPIVFTEWSEVAREGVPLHVDFAIDDARSVQLRHLGENRWRRCLFSEGSAGPGVRVAAEDVSVLSADKSLLSLDYRRYWAVGDDGAAHVLAQRFLGVTGANA